jgi:hypothetical protein
MNLCAWVSLLFSLLNSGPNAQVSDTTDARSEYWHWLQINLFNVWILRCKEINLVFYAFVKEKHVAFQTFCTVGLDHLC